MKISYNELVRGGDPLDQSIPCQLFAQRALRAGTSVIRVGLLGREGAGVIGACITLHPSSKERPLEIGLSQTKRRPWPAGLNSNICYCG